jgi:hypothetical protein
MKKIYRVVKHTYYEKGDKKKSHYSVQYQKKFLWWKLWSNITETECCEGECYNNPIVFHTESDAIYMIKNLQQGNKIQGWDEEVTTVLELPI